MLSNIQYKLLLNNALRILSFKDNVFGIPICIIYLYVRLDDGMNVNETNGQGSQINNA